jgi:hypothetical protein
MRLAAVQDKGDRTLVDHSDFHVGLKLAGADLQAQPLQFFYKGIVQRFRLGGRCRSAEGRPSSFGTIAIESEFGNDQNFAVSFGHGAVHLPPLVFEHSKPGDLGSQIIGVILGIFSRDTHQNAESRTYFGNQRSCDGDSGFTDSLNDKTQESFSNNSFYCATRRKIKRERFDSSRRLVLFFTFC